MKTGKATHFRLTLLKDMIPCGFSETIQKGESRLWEIKEILSHGAYIVQCGSIKSILQENEVSNGEKIVKESFELPIGMHFKIEKIYKPHWWNREKLLN